jgi:hypothetical protein
MNSSLSKFIRSGHVCAQSKNYQRDRSAIPKGNLNYIRNNEKLNYIEITTRPVPTSPNVHLLLFISFIYLDEEWATIRNKKTLTIKTSTESVFGACLPERQSRFLFLCQIVKHHCLFSIFVSFVF